MKDLDLDVCLENPSLKQTSTQFVLNAMGSHTMIMRTSQYLPCIKTKTKNIKFAPNPQLSSDSLVHSIWETYRGSRPLYETGDDKGVPISVGVNVDVSVSVNVTEGLG